MCAGLKDHEIVLIWKAQGRGRARRRRRASWRKSCGPVSDSERGSQAEAEADWHLNRASRNGWGLDAVSGLIGNSDAPYANLGYQDALDWQDWTKAGAASYFRLRVIPKFAQATVTRSCPTLMMMPRRCDG